MRLYRCAPERYVEDYRGLGASYKGGSRWSRPGLPVLYFGGSAGIALLEMANYLPSARRVPRDYRLGVYELSDQLALEQWQVGDLPHNWNAYPHRAQTQDMGSRWLMEGSTVALVVPSAAAPAGLERNVLVNPLHPDAAGGIQLLEVHDELYSERMFFG